jgi:hypothetical protein
MLTSLDHQDKINYGKNTNFIVPVQGVKLRQLNKKAARKKMEKTQDKKLPTRRALIEARRVPQRRRNK